MSQTNHPHNTLPTFAPTLRQNQFSDIWTFFLFESWQVVDHLWAHQRQIVKNFQQQQLPQHNPFCPKMKQRASRLRLLRASRRSLA